jgi:hypothetical protein
VDNRGVGDAGGDVGPDVDARAPNRCARHCALRRNGVGSVARGTVPLALFGAERYPVLMGRLGFPLLVAMAVWPYLGGVAFQKGGAEWTLLLLTVLAVANVILVGALRMVTRP